MKTNTPFDPVEISGAVLIVYFIITAIMVMMMEGIGIDADRATRIAPVMMPMMITIIMIARILETALRASVSVTARLLRSVRGRRASKEGQS